MWRGAGELSGGADSQRRHLAVGICGGGEWKQEMEADGNASHQRKGEPAKSGGFPHMSDPTKKFQKGPI